jgi:hypothetical protein
MRVRCLDDGNFKIECEELDRNKTLYIKNDGTCWWNSNCGVVLQFHFKKSIDECLLKSA